MFSTPQGKLSEPFFDRPETISEYLGVDTSNFYFLRINKLSAICEYSKFSVAGILLFLFNIIFLIDQQKDLK